MTDGGKSNPFPPDDSTELRAEARALRRRVEFWQRAVWLILGGGVIVATVIWQRGELRRRECFQALHHFAEEAERLHLADQHPVIFEQQWQNLPKGTTKLTAIHYDLIVDNWKITPKPDEELPLAVCRDSHLLLFTQGRNVLIRTSKGTRIDWRTEAAAAEVVELAIKDNRAK